MLSLSLGYMGVYPQQWQEQWNWGSDATEYTAGDQFCGNVAFFVPFPGMVGGVPMNNSNNTQENVETPQPTSKADLHEMEAKMAKLQAENQRLMQLCENERQMRQIEVSAKQQILEMYAVPRSEVEQLVRRFQEDSPAMQQMHYGENTTPFVSASNASTTAGSPGTTGSSATSLETLLQDLYKKLYEPEEHDDREQEEQGRTSRQDPWEANEASLPAEEEEMQQHLSHLESLVGMEIDDRAKGSLLRMSSSQGKLALRKVEDIIQEQGGFCHNLSSMVQSVCRKMGKSSRQWAWVESIEVIERYWRLLLKAAIWQPMNQTWTEFRKKRGVDFPRACWRDSAWCFLKEAGLFDVIGYGCWNSWTRNIKKHGLVSGAQDHGEFAEPAAECQRHGQGRKGRKDSIQDSHFHCCLHFQKVR